MTRLPDVTFPTLGWEVIDWIEAYLCHGPGDIQGSTLELDDEFAKFVLWTYRVHPKGSRLAGRRLIQRAVLSRAKGRAKSELAGALVCAEALGPVRFDGWNADDDPVGRPVVYPFIRCLATEEGQAGNTYDNVKFMLEEGEAANEYALDTGLSRTFIREPGGGEITPSTAGAESKDGGKETFSVADETHLYVLPKLRAMYGTVRNNTGKRKDSEPWMLDTTTAWLPGERSIAEQAAENYQHLDIEEAVLKRGVLYDHRQGDVPKRFGDDRSIAKAMRAAYGPAADWIDFDRMVRIVRDSEDPEETLYRYFLNRPRAAASHWLAPDEIAEAVFDKVPEPGSTLALGFDGSENDDHTALMACDEAGDLFTLGYWTPSGEEIGWRREVMDAVAWAFAEYEVVRFNGDPAWWQEELGKWAQEYGSPPVAEFWTGGRSEGKMAIASGALRTALRHGTRINPVPMRTPEQMRDGKTLVVWHFENARTRKVRVKIEDEAAEDAHILRKERKGSRLKIDSATSAVLARRARDDAVKLGAFDEPDYGSAQW